MRLQVAHVPQASARAGAADAPPAIPAFNPAGAALNPEPLRQFSACATAIAVSRFPTPAGPANSRLGGSESFSIDRDSRLTRRRWPNTWAKGMIYVESSVTHFMGSRKEISP